MKVLPGTGLLTDSQQAAPESEARPVTAGPAGRQITIRQRAGGLLLAAACVVAAAWYVPRVVGAGQGLLTGTVTSTGIVDLNFARAGQIASVLVSLGQRVRKGQLLATEAAPATAAIIRADRAAIAADKAEMAQLTNPATAGTPAAIAAARAQLAKDLASLAVDQEAAVGALVTAPADGTIVAINGQPGEGASADGIQDYPAQTQPAALPQQPSFSLLPETPQSSSRAAGAASAGQLPLVELRTSGDWEVVVLIPGNSATTVRPGEAVTVRVPAAHLQALRGRVEELPAASPVLTSSGVAYEVVVTVLGHQADPPLNGMTADVLVGG